MDAREFAAAPEWITVREVRRQVRVGGARRWVTLVTTLSDPSAEPVLEVVPERPGRDEPRAVKQRPKAYPRMTKPRDHLRRIQRQARQAAADRRAAFA